MFIKQAELFWGLGHDFVEAVTNASRKEAFEADRLLFAEGEPARRFYTLLSGRVNLTVGEEKRTVFSVSRAGESFGWSSLVGRNVYSATARCIEPTRVIEIDGETFWSLCNRMPKDGMAFMRRLAGVLGHRLIASYEAAGRSGVGGDSVAMGTEQVLESLGEE